MLGILCQTFFNPLLFYVEFLWFFIVLVFGCEGEWLPQAREVKWVELWLHLPKVLVSRASCLARWSKLSHFSAAKKWLKLWKHLEPLAVIFFKVGLWAISSTQYGTFKICYSCSIHYLPTPSYFASLLLLQFRSCYSNIHTLTLISLLLYAISYFCYC